MIGRDLQPGDTITIMGMWSETVIKVSFDGDRVLVCTTAGWTCYDSGEDVVGYRPSARLGLN